MGCGERMSAWSVSQIESTDTEMFIVRWTPTTPVYLVAAAIAGVGATFWTGVLQAQFPTNWSTEIGLGCLVLGTGMAGHRRYATMHRGNGLFREWHSVVAPFAERTVVVEPQSIRIERRARYDTESSTVSHTHGVYLVSLGAPQLTVAETADGVRAYFVAENAARFLGVPLDDRSEKLDSGTGIIARRVSEELSRVSRSRTSGAVARSRRPETTTPDLLGASEWEAR